MLQTVSQNIKNNASLNRLEIEDCERLSRHTIADYRSAALARQTTRLNSAADDAITLLNADHDYLILLFSAYKNSINNTEKTLLLSQICTELLLHRQVEEEVFYPAAKLALLDDGYLIDEPIIEHNGLIALIADIQHLNREENQQSDRNFSNKVEILAEYVHYHVKQERDFIFPKLREINMDLKALSREIALRKIALRKQATESNAFIAHQR